MPPPRRHPLLLLRLALAAALVAACAATPVGRGGAAPPPPPPPASSSDNNGLVVNQGVRILGMPPLVLCGIGACLLLTACAFASALRRRLSANAAADAHLQRAQTARAVALLAQQREQAEGLQMHGMGGGGGGGGAGLYAYAVPPVRGVVLALPWPPARGVPAYELLGELPAGYNGDGTAQRVPVIRCEESESDTSAVFVRVFGVCGAR
jgi:hypothetical protein